jgi:protease I
MAAGLGSAPVAFLAAGEGADQAELAHAWQAVIARHGHPVLVSPSVRDVELWQPVNRAVAMRVDVPVAEARAADFAGLVLLGGAVNAGQLRASPASLDLVGEFFTAGLPVAAIGRGPEVLMDAGVVTGRRLTSWPSLRIDLGNAGACWVDDQVVVCERASSTLITSRCRRDLPGFCQAFTQQFSVWARA